MTLHDKCISEIVSKRLASTGDNVKIETAIPNRYVILDLSELHKFFISFHNITLNAEKMV